MTDYRKHHKAYFGAALGPRDRLGIAVIATGPENSADTPAFVPMAEAAAACGAPGPGTRPVADRAYPPGEIVGWCHAHDSPCVIPARLNSSGRPLGTPGWRPHIGDCMVPRRLRRWFLRGGDVQSLPRGEIMEAQAGWTGRRGYSRRSVVEYVIGAFRGIFGGKVSARYPDNVALEIARKAIIHSASLP